MPDVIVPEIGDVRASSARKALVVRGRLVARVARQVMPEDAWIAKRGDDVGRVVSTAVPHDKDFEVAQGLVEHGSDRMTQDGAPVVRRDHDAHARRTIPVGHARTRRQSTFGALTFQPSRAPVPSSPRFSSSHFLLGIVGLQWELRPVLAFADQRVGHYDASVRAHVNRRCPRVTALLGCFSNQ